ncbi:hypothetical protein Q31b_42310 [Novipirellula aureliae]|uniref:Uncharacterized protein n=2 Tax=Novipirellula aureliae TaxID=2527966 RepID=A0A5C6DVS1_9BACT|nr:hypothetical protein Q31b_42310 [Novipirellula aureliae]
MKIQFSHFMPSVTKANADAVALAACVYATPGIEYLDNETAKSFLGKLSELANVSRGDISQLSLAVRKKGYTSLRQSVEITFRTGVVGTSDAENTSPEALLIQSSFDKFAAAVMGFSGADVTNKILESTAKAIKN